MSDEYQPVLRLETFQLTARTYRKYAYPEEFVEVRDPHGAFRTVGYLVLAVRPHAKHETVTFEGRRWLLERDGDKRFILLSHELTKCPRCNGTFVWHGQLCVDCEWPKPVPKKPT